MFYRCRRGRETAYSHRDAEYSLGVATEWDDPAESETNISWVREQWKVLKPFTTEGVYVNFLGDEGEDRVKDAYGA